MPDTAVAIVDYEIGNLRSVANALVAAGGRPEIVRDGAALAAFGHVLLPGVGAFAPGMQALRASGLADALSAHAAGGGLVLGICLGMQLLCKRSLEDGEHEGLGWVDADVVPIDAGTGVKVPHIGWNDVSFTRQHPLVEGVPQGSDVYFNHSFVVRCRDAGPGLGETVYGTRFTSMLAQDNVFGIQFHPEKSQLAGIAILRNFLAMRPAGRS